MANFLASVGRAQPSQTLANVLRLRFEQQAGERAQQSLNSQLALQTEQLAQIRRRGQLEQQAYEQDEQMLPVEPIMDAIEGGRNGPMAQGLYRLAKSQGYIDESIGGLGGIKRRDLIEVSKLASQPEFESKLSLDRMAYWRGQLDQANQVLSEKPEDKMALRLKQQASDALTMATFQNQQMLKQHELASKESIAAAGIESRESIAQAQITSKEAIAEAERKIRAENLESLKSYRGRMATAAEIKAEKAGGGEDKKQIARRKDYFHLYDKAIGALTGAGTFFPMDEKQRRQIASDSLSKARTIAQQYVKNGGNLADLGLSDINDLRALEKLPEGLTWEDIDYMQKKYNKTASEIIEDYKRLYKGKSQ